MELSASCTITTRDGIVLPVRRLIVSDAASLQAFNAALSPDTRRKFGPHAYDDATVAKVLMRSENGDDYVLGAFDGGQLACYFFLWFIRKRIPLLGIGMLDAFQHRGLGRQVMLLLIDHAVAEGCDGIKLTTMQDNHHAFALYRKLGFEYYGDVENQIGDGTRIVERGLFYRIKPGAQPTVGGHAPPA